MEKLTYVTENGEVLFHPEDLPADEGMTIAQLAKEGRIRALETIAEKLANYEQAEEQGLLLRLPCKVGDTVYYLERFCGGAMDCPSGPCEDCPDHEFDIFEGEFKLTDLCYFGKTMFLTREAAENKMKTML